MSYEWHYDLSTDRPNAIEAFGDLYTAYALEGEYITQNSLCKVIRVELDGVGYFIKKYRRGSENPWTIFAKSKARSEWSNLLRFAQWDLPVARVVAWGEESLLGVAGHGLVITEEVAGATDLSVLAKDQSPLLLNKNWVSSVSSQLASATAIMHSHQFAHNDLKWRNILVSGQDHNPKITLIDCPAGRFWWQPFFEYRRIKDLACLDKVAKNVLRRSQRLKFYYYYQGTTKLSGVDKSILKRVMSFFKGRD